MVRISLTIKVKADLLASVVLMDELDQLVTAKQDVVYNFFNWPTLVGSKLIVIAVANTMDLPERVMTGRVRSRLGESIFCRVEIA
jgi:origin recognition complex subunit 1